METHRFVNSGAGDILTEAAEIRDLALRSNGRNNRLAVPFLFCRTVQVRLALVKTAAMARYGM